MCFMSNQVKLAVSFRFPFLRIENGKAHPNLNARSNKLRTTFMMLQHHEQIYCRSQLSRLHDTDSLIQFCLLPSWTRMGTCLATDVHILLISTNQQKSKERNSQSIARKRNIQIVECAIQNVLSNLLSTFMIQGQIRMDST